MVKIGYNFPGLILLMCMISLHFKKPCLSFQSLDSIRFLILKCHISLIWAITTLHFEILCGQSCERSAEAEFRRGSASDLCSVCRGSVNILVADPRHSIGDFPTNLCFSNMHRSASRSRESETNSYRSAAIPVMADCCLQSPNCCRSGTFSRQ